MSTPLEDEYTSTDELSLVGAQLGIWHAEQVSRYHNSFTVAQYVDISGKLEVELLQRAIKLGLSEADTLQGDFYFSEKQQKPVQRLNAKSIDIEVEVLSLDYDSAITWMDTDIAQSLLCDGTTSLFRHTLIKVGDDNWLWYQRYHHIQVDGFSFNAICKRIVDIYSLLLQGKELTAPMFESFEQSVVEYQQYLVSEKFERDQTFWRQYGEQLPVPYSLSVLPLGQGDLVDVNSLSADRVNMPPALRQRFTLEPSIADSFSTIAAVSGVKLPDLVTATLMAYLARMEHRQMKSDEKYAVCCGYVFMRRMGFAALTGAGPAMNVLPLMVELKGDEDLVAVAKSIAWQVRKLKRHQAYDVEQLQRDLTKVNGEKLFGATINCKLFDYHLDFSSDSESVIGETFQLATGPIDDIEFSIYLHQQKITIEMAADSGRYNQQALVLHGHRLQFLLNKWLNEPKMPLAQLPVISIQERVELMEWSTGEQVDYRMFGTSVLNLFDRQWQAQPHKTALVGEDQQLSFVELADKANQVSHLLLGQGVSKGDIVAVALPKSIDSIVAILAIFRLGAIYLPLDLALPDQRLAVICDDAKPSCILTLADIAARFDEQQDCLLFNQDKVAAMPIMLKAPALSLDDTAYIFYTSGSTGKPKGVMVPHRGLVNLYVAMEHRIYSNLEAFHQCQLNVALTGALTFDTSWDPVLLLLAGERLFIYSDELKKDAGLLCQAIERDSIDIMAMAPQLAGQLLNAGVMTLSKPPMLMDICGEAIAPSLWQQLQQYPQLQAHNIYGPTEFTVYATSALVNDDLPEVVIGKPLANTQAYVLDEQLQLAPIGVAGELYLAGDNLAQGYLNRAEFNATRFVANPFATDSKNGQRMYRTGDLVRWNESGELVFIGRTDHQVKVRGFRIEMGEVEAALSQIEQIHQAAVVVQQVATGNRLLAFCTIKSDIEFNSNDIEQAMLQLVPNYMVPAVIQVIDEMPLTVSGKIDRKALGPQLLSVNSNTQENVELTTQQKLVANAIIDNLALDNQLTPSDDFFLLGGDSISAMGLSTSLRRLGYQLSVREIFGLRSVFAMSQGLGVLDGNNQASAEVLELAMSLTAIEREQLQTKYQPLLGESIEILPTLPLQQGLVFQSALQQTYSFTTKLSLKNTIDIARLQQALNMVLVQFPQLLACFDGEIASQPVQLIPAKVDSDARWPLYVIDLIEQADAEQQLERHALNLAQHQFEMVAQQPLLRADVFVLSGASGADDSDIQHQLILTFHHLLIDGWSLPIVLQALQRSYQQFDVHGIESSLPQFTQVIQSFAQRGKAQAREVWQQHMQDAPVTCVFEKNNSQAVQDTRIVECHLTLTRNESLGLIELCKDNGITLNTLMQGVWAAQLMSLMSTDSVVFGSPVSGRSCGIDGIEQQVGLFTNTLPVWVKLQPQQSIVSQLSQLQQLQLMLMEHDQLGLGDIQQLCGVSNWFDTLLVVENYPLKSDQQAADNLDFVDFENRGFTHYPMTVLVLPGEEIRVLFEYQAGIGFGDLIAQRTMMMLKQLLLEPQMSVNSMPLMSPIEQQLLEQINRTDVVLPVEPSDQTLVRILQQQRVATPSQIALVDAKQTLSYAQFDQKVCALATYLANISSSNGKGSGIGRGDIVAVSVPRSAELTISLHGVIETGAAYLPLDSSYPDVRLAMMLEDAAPKLLITTSEFKARFADLTDIPLLCIDELGLQQLGVQPLKREIKPSDPAYVIFTSGSTGRPKGVVVSHGAIVNRILWMQHQYALAADDVVLQKTPSSFDVSVWEFFWPLMVGARLVMAPVDAHKDPHELWQWMVEFNVTTMHFVPSMLAAMVQYASDLSVDERAKLSLKQVFASGEALPQQLISQYLQLIDAPLHNLYGPTEAAVDVSYCPAIEQRFCQGAGLPIGQPVWNTQLRILNHQFRQVGIGVAGELYISGNQLAIGYLGRPDLTAERFIADPYADGQRMYRTGDIARFLPNGDIEYLGRADFQLKIRGQRIELADIEQQIAQFDNVAQAVVDAKEVGQSLDSSGDNRQLVAYVQLKDADAEIDFDSLRQSLVDQLPAHMVPSFYMTVDEFALSASGKLDRKALPLPQVNEVDAGDQQAARVGAEAIIAAAFAEILELDSVDANQSFFALGGHSLLAMRLAAKLRQALSLPVSVGQIITLGSVSELARVLVDEQLRNDPASAGFGQILPIRDGNGTPLICIHPGSGFAWQYTVFNRHLTIDCPIIGIQSPRPDGALAVSENMEAAIEQYYALLKQVQPTGPYRFLGYSLGGTIAMALASRLTAQGESVEFIGLVDVYPPEQQEWKRPTAEEAEKEVEMERRQFLAATKVDESEMDEETAEAFNQQQEQMFNNIVGNYEDSVRLLSKATTETYDGKVDIFVAVETLPEGWDVAQSWAPFVSDLHQHRLPFSHDSIMAPESVETVGPMLNEMLLGL